MTHIASTTSGISYVEGNEGSPQNARNGLMQLMQRSNEDCLEVYTKSESQSHQIKPLKMVAMTRDRREKSNCAETFDSSQHNVSTQANGPAITGVVKLKDIVNAEA